MRDVDYPIPEKETLSCVVSGSFKIKPQIDRVITHFEELGVKVLAPSKGGLYRSEFRDFFPLIEERGFHPSVVENSFLRAIKRADFLYVVNPDGYIGNSVAFEIGYAYAFKDKDIYLSNAPAKSDDPYCDELFLTFPVKTPEETIKDMDFNKNQRVLKVNSPTILIAQFISGKPLYL